MKTFSFTVKDTFFPQTFKGEIQAESIEAAKEIILEDYAYELDTDPSELNVTIKEVII
jgi:uncharacterized membrane protein YgaE (UPF0421/DUF939 family)